MAKAKGTVMVGLVKALRRNKEKAREILPAKLLHYLDERIVVASWYPVEDYVVLLRAVGKISPSPNGNTFIEMGRISARDHMEGTYSRLKKERESPGRVHAADLDVRHRRDESSGARARPRAARVAGLRAPHARGLRDVHRLPGAAHGDAGLRGRDRPPHQVPRRRRPSCRWDISWKGRAQL